MPAIVPARIAVADANVFINLIHVQRLGMLGLAPRVRVRRAGRRHLGGDRPRPTVGPRGRTLGGSPATGNHHRSQGAGPVCRTAAGHGAGEAACVTLAEPRGWLIASDEKRRFRRE